MLPRTIITLSLTIALLTFTFLLIPGASIHAWAQQPSAPIPDDTAQGIKLYDQGNTEEAIKVLKKIVKDRQDDVDAWYHLGLAYFHHDKLKDARKAFEMAVRLRPNFALARSNLAYTLLDLNKFSDASGEAQNALALDPANATAHYVMGVVYMKEGMPAKAVIEAEAALKARNNFLAALLLKSQALFAAYMAETYEIAAGASPPSTEESSAARESMLKEAADSLEKYLQLEPNAANAEIWREQLETLRFYASLRGKTKRETQIYSGKDMLQTKVRIISKPEPAYTDAARQAGVEGKVVLQAVFAADGKVKYILVLRPLPKGLTEKAVDAARKIKFAPAVKDGKPVSMFYRIEYNFNLY